MKSILVSIALAMACMGADKPRSTVPPGLGPVIMKPHPDGQMHVPHGPGQRGIHGWYFHKPTKTWRHDGGTHPVQYRSDDRQYVQLEVNE